MTPLVLCRVTTTFYLPLSWLEGLKTSANTHKGLCICRNTNIYKSTHVHTHIYPHSIFSVCCQLRNSWITVHVFIIIIAEVHGLMCYGTLLRLLLSSGPSLLAWEPVFPILRVVFLANFFTAHPHFALLILLILNHIQSWETLVMTLFQLCTISSSLSCWHFPFKCPYSLHMACTHSSPNKIISCMAV